MIEINGVKMTPFPDWRRRMSIKRRRATVLALILALFSVSNLPFSSYKKPQCQEAVTSTLVAESDAYAAEISPDENFGSTESLRVASGPDTDERALIRFDLSSVPPGADVVVATLSLYVTQSSSQERIYECYRISSSWEENTVSWNSMPKTVSRFVGEANIETSSGWVTWDVTEHVRLFLTGIEEHAWENYGWMIKDKSEDSYVPANASFISTESLDENKRPYLYCSFNPPKLSLSSDVTTIMAGDWVKMTLKRLSQDGVIIMVGDRVVKKDWIDVGRLTVKLSSSSPTGKFSSTIDGDPISEILIPEGALQSVFYYIGDTTGSHLISVNTDDYQQGYYDGDSATVMVMGDLTPPEISNVVRTPEYPAMGETVTVSATIIDSDSGVGNAELHYSNDGGATWSDVEMVSLGDTYEAWIPSQNLLSEVMFYIKATDSAGNNAETPVERFSVGIPIWLYSVVAGALIVIALVVALVIRRRRIR